MDNCVAPDGSSPFPEAAASSVYASDEFRLYCHKILPCSKRTPHDWASCHFAHPGEKAKRRNIRTHSYDCEMCPDVVKGVECKLGANCPHSHNVFESWLHPQKYRTMMCKDRDRCTRPVCFFAHGPHELRTPTDPAPLPQQIDGSDAAAAAAARAVSNQSNSGAAGGVMAGSMQNWQLMQSQLSELARGGSNVSMQSSGMFASGPSTPRMTPASSPAAPYLCPGASAALLSPAATGLQQGSTRAPAGCSTSSMALPGNSSMLCSPNSSRHGMAELPASDQVARMLQQAGNPAMACWPAGGPLAGVSMQHLLHNMAQQVNVSRQEAQQCRDVATQAQQQLVAIMTALGPQGPLVVSSTGTPAGGLPMGWQPQQLQTDPTCASSNQELYRDGSDLSTHLTYLDRSSSTLPDMSSGACTQQQLFSAAFPVSGTSVWRCDSDAGLMFMPESSGSGSGPAGGASHLVHKMSGEVPAAAALVAQSSLGKNPSAFVSAAIRLQQQQLQARQAFGGPAADAAGAVAGLVGANGGLGVLNREQQQLLQQMQAYQQSAHQASSVASMAGYGQAATAGAVKSPPMVFRM